MGGINAAGRSSLHWGFQRMIYDQLDRQTQQHTLQALAQLTGTALDQQLASTLIRALPADRSLTTNLNVTAPTPTALTVRKMDLPATIPDHWTVESRGDKHVYITVPAHTPLRIPVRDAERRVSAAGQLPTGFAPGNTYPSRHHPRALQMTVFGASDTLGSLGLPWQTVMDHVAADRVGVFASNAMAQLDQAGIGGVMRSPLQGQRITAKQVPLGLGEMCADFINAYVLRTMGLTGGMLGACATFLYNLERGISAIRSGRARVVMVGTSEAPLEAEIMEGYRAMGALAEDRDLAALDGVASADLRRACRPFSDNCGFTMGESAQFALLMADDLALELGAPIMAAVPDVFIHADGAKKSISAPGVGNYITLGKAAHRVRQLIGEQGLRHHSYVHAHGTGTPQNRTTESRVLDRTATAFGISDWPVVAIKAYVGHTLGSASGDQLAAALGGFANGWLPGIQTVDHIADDVHQAHLRFCLQHQARDDMQATLINSKGFGGNNATAVVLSPDTTKAMLAQRHGQSAITAWQHRHENSLAGQQQHRQHCLSEAPLAQYHFDQGVIQDSAVSMTADSLTIGDRQITLQDDEALADYALKR